MTVYELSIIGLVHPDSCLTHAIAGVDELVKNEDGDILTCGILHPMDGELEPEDCPVASRWTICR